MGLEEMVNREKYPVHLVGGSEFIHSGENPLTDFLYGLNPQNTIYANKTGSSTFLADETDDVV